MIDLFDIRYLRIGTPRLDEAIEFATKIVGLQLVAREGKAAYFRSDKVPVRGDTRDHTLVYFEGDPKDHAVGFDLRDPAAIDAVVRSLRRRAIRCAWAPKKKASSGVRARCCFPRIRAATRSKS